MAEEIFTQKTHGHCKCSPSETIVRYENSNLSAFKWKHRYTFSHDEDGVVNIFRCSICKEVIHDNFIALPTPPSKGGEDE